MSSFVVFSSCSGCIVVALVLLPLSHVAASVVLSVCLTFASAVASCNAIYYKRGCGGLAGLSASVRCVTRDCSIDTDCPPSSLTDGRLCRMPSSPLTSPFAVCRSPFAWPAWLAGRETEPEHVRESAVAERGHLAGSASAQLSRTESLVVVVVACVMIAF